jgi:virginiamycin B lyase
MNPTSGAHVDYAVPVASAAPFSIVAGPDGALWYTDVGSNQIGRLTTTGAFQDFPLPTSNALPQQIVVGPDGNLWTTESGAGKIAKIPPSIASGSGSITEYPMADPGCVSGGIASGPLNSLWYVGCVGSFVYTIDQVSLSGVQTIYQPPSGFGAVDPRFLTVGADGAIWFTDQNANYIGRLAPIGGGAGTWTKYPYPLVNDTTTGNASANWIFAASDGSLWWTDFKSASVGHLIP